MSGQQEKGFDISLQEAGDLIKVQTWGVWDEQVARQFEQAFCLEVQHFTKEKGAWQLLVDFSQFPPQPPEVEHILTDMMFWAKNMGMARKAILAKSSPLSLLQERLNRDPVLKVHFYFQRESDAMHWLLRDLFATRQ